MKKVLPEKYIKEPTGYPFSPVLSIEGKEIAEKIPDVKVIKLDNAVNHIMSKEEYRLLEEDIDAVVTSF